MKPSERIKAEAQEFLNQNFPQPHNVEQVTRAMFKTLLAYVDQLEERAAKLEQIAGCMTPHCVDGRQMHDFQGATSCPACGWTPQLIGRTEHGDAVFGLRRYEPEPEGSEEL